MGRVSGQYGRSCGVYYKRAILSYKKLFILLFYLSLSAMPCKTAFAAKPVLRRNVAEDGEIVSVQGEGWVQLIGLTNWTDAAMRQILTAGDRVKTGNYGKMSILFADDTQIIIHRNSLLFVKGVSRTPGKKGTILKLDAGEIWSRARTNPEGLMIETPSATAAIRGTDWDMTVDKKGTTSLTVLKGLVKFYNDYGKVMVGMNEQAIAEVGKAPVKTFLVKPKQRVQWLYTYPFDAAGLPLLAEYQSKNEIEKAAQALEELRHKADSASVGIAYASFVASQGDFARAIGICRGYAARYPSEGRFHTMMAEFYLVLDEGAKAKDAIEKALSINPRSSVAFAVLGKYYYLEGKGKEAEAAYRKALSLDGTNAEAHYGLATVLMEKGYFRDALASFSDAAKIAPGRPDYLSKKGTLYNWIEDIADARNDYRKATDIDPADYQSLDGLGFLLLKEGKTKEAVNYFLKASLLSPEFAEPHIYLAIAYYQLGNIEDALQELKLAETLDPKDPAPHIMAYVIYQDTYRQMDSIQEARKALALLPFLKSMTPVKTTQKGLTNLGSSLLGLGMDEWAASYAAEAYNPYNADSHFFNAKRFSSNDFAFVSEMSQGFILDPLSIYYSPRYQDFVRRPRNNVVTSITVGDDGGGFSRDESAQATGYFRKPWETVYFLSAEDNHDDGFRINGHSEEQSLQFALGGKPDYENGFFLWGFADTSRYGDPGTATNPDSDDHDKDLDYFAALGYHHRFGPKNYALAQVAYDYQRTGYFNPDSFGAAFTPEQADFVGAFGLNTARDLFDSGIYYDGTYMGAPFFSTSNLVDSASLPAIPAYVDSNYNNSSKNSLNVFHLQLRHMFNITDSHEVTYGMEYVPSLNRQSSVFTGLTPGLSPFFFCQGASCEGPYTNIYLNSLLSYSSLAQREKSTTQTYYLDDRWRVSESFLVEAGIFEDVFRLDANETGDLASAALHDSFTRLDPRAGFSLKLGRHILRVAYKKQVSSGGFTTLAPADTAGLVFEPSEFLLVAGTKLTDGQAQLESRWSDRIFTEVSAERRRFQIPEEEGLPTISTINRADIFSGAINAVLTERTGIFARYKYNYNRFENGIFEGKAEPLVPQHAFTTGLVWVSPAYVKTSLSATYSADQFGDYENTYKMPDYWTADFLTQWEPLKKHVFVSLAVNNMFNKYYETKQGYPAAGRSVFLTAEYRF